MFGLRLRGEVVTGAGNDHRRHGSWSIDPDYIGTNNICLITTPRLSSRLLLTSTVSLVSFAGIFMEPSLRRLQLRQVSFSVYSDWFRTHLR